MPATVGSIRSCIESAVPDPTGSKNVYTVYHFSAAAAAVAAAFASGRAWIEGGRAGCN
jgi:hypothetical protein